MGLAASQGRLLSLTSRLSDLERRSQSLSNQKMRLTSISTQAANKYQAALAMEKITFNNGKKTVVARPQDFMEFNPNTKQRYLKTADNKLLVDSRVANALRNSSSKDEFLSALGLRKTSLSSAIKNDQEKYIQNNKDSINNDSLKNINDSNYADLKENWEEHDNVKVSTLDGTGSVETTQYGDADGKDLNGKEYDSAEIQFYTNIYNEAISYKDGKRMENFAELNNNMKTAEWLNTNLTSGNIYLAACQDDGSATRINYKYDDESICVESDSTYIAQAQAEYDATNAELTAKEKRIDQEMKNNDTEHSAIQQEIDSVTKVRDKNIQSTFKLFG